MQSWLGLGAVGAGNAEDGVTAHADRRHGEDAEMQATVLAAEDRRLIEVRTVTSLARWQGRELEDAVPAGHRSAATRSC